MVDSMAKVLDHLLAFAHFNPNGHVLVTNCSVTKEVNDAPTPLMGPPLVVMLALDEARARKSSDPSRTTMTPSTRLYLALLQRGMLRAAAGG